MEKQPSALRKQENPQNLIQGLTQRIDILRRVSGHVKVTRLEVMSKEKRSSGRSSGAEAGVLQHESVPTVEKRPGLS